MMKNLLTNESERRFNEVVFQGRHKGYGAYTLRSEEERIMKKALLIGIFIFAGAAMVPMIANSFKDPGKVVVETPPPAVMVDVSKPDVKPLAPAATAIRNKVPQLDTRVPTPAANPLTEKPAVTVSDYDHAVPGIKDVEGVQNSAGSVASVTMPPSISPSAEVKVQPPADNAARTVVEIEASFTGGLDAFRGKVQNNFDVSNFEGSGETLKTVVTFIVEKDGTISNIKAMGSNNEFNAEAEKTMRFIKGKWIPAQVKGEFVRSYFKFPISMKFE